MLSRYSFILLLFLASIPCVLVIWNLANFPCNLGADLHDYALQLANFYVMNCIYTKRWAPFSMIWILSTLQALFSEHLSRSQASNGNGAGVRDPSSTRVKGLDHYDWWNYLHEKEYEWLRTSSRLS